MKTEKQKVQDYLRKQGFTLSPVLIHKPFTPHYRRTPEGDHTLIDSIHCALYDGVDTPKGGLGCVVFCCSGLFRLKRHRHTYQDEMLKHVKVYNTAAEVIAAYKQWAEETKKTLAEWETII